jgi:fatty acid desaturase
MTQSSPELSPSKQPDLRQARALIVKELGADKLAELHRPNIGLDLAAIFGSLALFVFIAFALATRSAREPLWWLCLFVQGDLILILAYLNHDLFVHRKLLPPKLRWVVSSVLVWPSQLRAAAYEQKHLLHHRALGTEADSEFYKHSINTRLRRFLYATVAMVFYRAIFLRGQTASLSVERPSAERKNQPRARYERVTWWAILACALAAALVDYRLVLYGYLLPYALVTPFLNSIRIILEHFDLEPRNPLWNGTFYKTGPLTRVMFCWDAGDCHLVHHFYASIPFYRMGQALRVMRPILIRHGVYEHRSLTQLMRQWFADARAHWSVPLQAARDPATESSLQAAPAGEPR